MITYHVGDFVRILLSRPLSELGVVLEVVAVDTINVAHFVHVSDEEGLESREVVTADTVWFSEVGVGY